MKRACFWIENETFDNIKKQAEIEQASQGWIIREAMKLYVDNKGKIVIDLKDDEKQKIRKECLLKGLTLNTLVSDLVRKGLAV
jgi:DNA-binding transcriptional regulator/RsmH inhibitor MraZ